MLEDCRTNICILIFIGLFLASCLDKREGCLDPNASNFDVSVDIQGECTYPSLRLNVLQRDSEGLFSKGNVIYFTSEDSARLNNFAYFLSDIYLVFDSGDTLRSLDLFKISSTAGTKSTSDLVFVDNQENALLIGRIAQSGRITGLHLRFGLDEEVKVYDPNTLSSSEFGNHTNAYFSSAEVLLDTIDQNYDFAYFLWFKDTTEYKVTIPNESLSYDVFLPIDTNVVAGQGLTVGVAMDFSQWWNEIDLTDSLDQIISSLEENFDAAIEVIE